MEQPRIHIVDIAQALGLSTATVFNVIHGKPEKQPCPDHHKRSWMVSLADKKQRPLHGNVQQPMRK